MKQAVVLIHGVGEQVPMDTLRGFAKAVWTTDDTTRRPKVPSSVWSKPDKMSGDFELRRLTTAENRENRRTDFFEFYWAHMMEDTALSHVGAWLKVLVLRPPLRVPAQLQGIWWLLVILLVIAAAASLNQVIGWWEVSTRVKTTGAALWALLGSSIIWFVIHYAGDAARYLHVAPANIQIRRRIREAGVQLLQTLHESGQYDRIIVVGHSLGSVVGYDVLTHLWPRYHDSHVSTAAPAANASALAALEQMVQETEKASLNLDAFQEAQTAYLRELRGLQCPWLVTDFITLGSPLSHAAILLARNQEEFERKKSEREFPTCPPRLEKVAKQMRFTFAKGKQWVPHHAAVFGPTRWTNVYFPCRGTLCGDVIGGPLAPAFGLGIRDIPVATTIWRGLFSHTKYWTLPKKGHPDDASWIQDLRRAIRICESPAQSSALVPAPVVCTP